MHLALSDNLLKMTVCEKNSREGVLIVVLHFSISVLLRTAAKILHDHLYRIPSHCWKNQYLKLKLSLEIQNFTDFQFSFLFHPYWSFHHHCYQRCEQYLILCEKEKGYIPLRGGKIERQ